MAENQWILHPACMLSCSRHQNMQFCLFVSAAIRGCYNVHWHAVLLCQLLPVAWSLVPRLCHIPGNMLGQRAHLKPGKKINTRTLLSFSSSSGGTSSSCRMKRFQEKEDLCVLFLLVKLRFRIPCFYPAVMIQMNTCILQPQFIFPPIPCLLFSFLYDPVLPVSHSLHPISVFLSLSLYVD